MTVLLKLFLYEEKMAHWDNFSFPNETYKLECVSRGLFNSCDFFIVRRVTVFLDYTGWHYGNWTRKGFKIKSLKFLYHS